MRDKEENTMNNITFAHSHSSSSITQFKLTYLKGWLGNKLAFKRNPFRRATLKGFFMGKSFKRLWKVGRVDDCSSFENCSFARCDAGGSNPSPSSNIWKVGRAVECSGLESRRVSYEAPKVRILHFPPNKQKINGSVAEWIIAAVLKTVEL